MRDHCSPVAAGSAMSANVRQHPYRVAILGFNDFERASLASCLRLSEHRAPAYAEAVAPPELACDFLVADADAPDIVARVWRERRSGDAVFIGRRPPHDAVAWLLRPIEPALVMRALDTLLAARFDGAPAADAEPDAAPAAAPKRRPNRARSAEPAGGGGRPVLVVDDSRVARSFLAQRLAALGYRVSVAASADEALERAAASTFAIVFLDLKLGDHDPLGGLQVCRALKEAPRAPAVVITTASGSSADRVRGSLAGCDAYLVKPLLPADFTAALAQVDPRFASAIA